MKIFLFLGSRKGYAVFKKLIEAQAEIAAVLCLVEDPHEEQYHLRVTALAHKQSIPIFYSTAVKPAAYPELLKKIKPDLAFAIGWRYLITPTAYTVPPLGTFILHDSLLPKYRGFAPLSWAMINGEKETGVTLFHIAEGVDSGPIVDQLATSITMIDTVNTVEERIIKLYEEIIIKNLSILQTGQAITIPQDEVKASYCCKRIPQDGEINWQQSAIAIHNLIRAVTHPLPGAYSFLNGKKIFIWEAEVADDQLNYVGNIPGRVLGKKNNKIEVLTGKGILALKRLQGQDEPERCAADFLVSIKDTFGH